MRLIPCLSAILTLGTCISCRQPSVVIVHVIRDPSSPFAGQLRSADEQFTLTKPTLNSGQGVMIATNEGGSSSFQKLLQELAEMKPELLILDSEQDLRGDAALVDKLGRPQSVCDRKLAYVPGWVSAEKREAAEKYVHFLETHCK